MADVRDLIARGIRRRRRQWSRAGVIRRDYHAELDELRDITKQGRQLLRPWRSASGSAPGSASLKIRYNQVFGFYIEISKANLHLARPITSGSKLWLTREVYIYRAEGIRTQGAVGRERVLEIERRLYGEIREAIAHEAARLRRTAARYRSA